MIDGTISWHYYLLQGTFIGRDATCTFDEVGGVKIAEDPIYH